MRTITVLSVRQPWAWLLCEGLKDVENRNWKTNYRGELFIHAGKSFDWNAFRLLSQAATTHCAGLKAMEHFDIRFGKSEITAYKDEFGAIVGRVDLIDCGRSPSIWAQQEVKYHWTVRSGQHIIPIPMRGQLGLFKSSLKGEENDMF